MADIPANHQQPADFTPSRPGDDHEPAIVWTLEQWEKENEAALRAEGKPPTPAPVPVAGQEE